MTDLNLKLILYKHKTGGRHCCLFCNITSKELQVSLATRGNYEKRTLLTLKSDYDKFQAAGGNIKDAKHFNNVIDEVMFNVPIEQVALPALHISLGSYLKFFNMLEDRCHLLDVKIAAAMAVNNRKLDQNDFDAYVTTQSKIRDLEYLAGDYENKINLVYEAINSNI